MTLRIVLIVVVAALCVVALDVVCKERQHMSVMTAPLNNFINFAQTLALFLNVDTPWPQGLRDWMQRFSVFSGNLELAKPECAAPFSAEDKMMVVLLCPVLVGCVVLLFAIFKLVVKEVHGHEKFMQTHGGQTPFQYVQGTTITLVVYIFSMGSIFFLKNLLIVYSCSKPNDDAAGRSYMYAYPEIECDLDNERYRQLSDQAAAGMMMYALSFLALFIVMILDKRILLKYMGDKYEPAFFYFDLVHILRKNLLLATALVFRDSTSYSWLLNMSILLVSLIIHSAAKPYEDWLTDWTGFLDLLSSVLLLMTAPVYALLRDPNAAPSACLNSDADECAEDSKPALIIWLTNVQLIVVLLYCLINMWCQLNIFRVVNSGSEDYKEQLMQRRIDELEQSKTKMAERLAVRQ